MKHPRMWMQVGVWPPPVHAVWRPSQKNRAHRRRWIAAGVVVAVALGATLGSVVTLLLVGQVGS